jgi:hypothetical protein
MKFLYILNTVDKQSTTEPIGIYTTVNNAINGALEYTKLTDKEPLTEDDKDNLSKNFTTMDREEENYLIQEVKANVLFEEI